ncbi:hypothetical protein C5167_027892 [Papaver somniferum]|uniref:protein arginine N-methyltransferase PRMT10-like n=1 Tax=Papaver somniferum TaxID=3469 RepID=UPI000E700063|nr:protein arginine N-methyltransferase PRMT10-like [Papaver somniferum]RZC92003.1 hypothetical protein C5167_027892 [Papaver somniferum]
MGTNGGGRTNGGGGGVDKGVDFANYFCTYGFLYHQKEMLCDRVRMDAYYNSIFENKEHFIGKTVLDVGTGSGILAIWSAQAGAKKVYAVEATKMSEHARELVKANNLQDVVEVIEGTVEDITLPEKVDVIISEWMGYFLLRESMFDSVIVARDRWLKPTGMMYPSHARMWVAPIRSGLGDQKMSDFEACMGDWSNFLKETKTYYGVDMSVLTNSFGAEQKKYYLQTSIWNNLHPHQVIGKPCIIKEMDCLTATVSEIRSVQASFSSLITEDRTRLCGFAGWFDVHFRGNKENPAKTEVELTTAPSMENGTHWGQQVFLLHPSIHVREGDELNVSFSMDRSKENHRLMEVELGCEMREASGKQHPSFSKRFYIE